MGTTTVSAPQPSKEERALQAQQAALLKQQGDILNAQYEQQKTLLPFFASQAGIELKYDANGKIIGASKIDDPLEKQQKDIQFKLGERSLAALEGKLPVDPNLEQALASQEETLRARLQKQFGPGYETGTPGIQTLDQFFKSAEGLRYGARTGQLTLSEQLGLARGEEGRATQGQNLNIYRGFGVSDPLAISQGYASNAQGYGQAQIPYIQNRQMQLQASMANAQNQMGMMQGFGSLAGTLFGAAFPFGFQSDRRLKYEVELLLDGPIPIYAYGIYGERRLGVMAQDVLEVAPWLVGRSGPWLTVRYGGLHG